MNDLAEQDLINAMLPMLRSMYEELRGFSNLTGNTRNSLAVGLYRDGTLVGHVYGTGELGVKRPIRMTLKNGDVYDLPEDWDGNALDHPVMTWGGKPKRDWAGDRNFWADEEAVRFIESRAPMSNGFVYIFVSAIDYAQYLEAKGNINVLTQWHDELRAAGATVSGLPGQGRLF